MNPEQLQQILSRLTVLEEYVRQRKLVQLPAPVDDISKNNIGAASDEGTGTTALTDTIALSGGAENIDVPKAYADTEIIVIGGKRMEIPVISYP